MPKAKPKEPSELSKPSSPGDVRDVLSEITVTVVPVVSRAFVIWSTDTSGWCIRGNIRDQNVRLVRRWRAVDILVAAHKLL